MHRKPHAAAMHQIASSRATIKQFAKLCLFAARGKTRRDDSPNPGPETIGSIGGGRRQALPGDARRKAHRTIRGDREETRPDSRTVHTGGERDRQERRGLHFQDSAGIRRLQQRMPEGK